MNEQTKAVSELSRSAIDLAQAAGDLGALKVIFGVFMVMMLLIIIMFVYQTFTTSKRLGVIEEAAEKVVDYFAPISNRTIGREEAKAIIRLSVGATGERVKYAILKIREENHLAEHGADERINDVVMNEYDDRMAILNRFMLDGKELSYVCNIENQKRLEMIMKHWVYMPNDQFTPSFMTQAVEGFINKMKASYQKRIDELP